MATPGASPGHWPWQAGRPASSGLCSMEQGVPQLQRRCLFRRDLLCQPGSPSVGSEYLVDKPWWGAWTPCQEEGWAHAQLCPPWQSDGTSVAATAVTPAWGTWKEGAEQKHVWVAVRLRGRPVCRRAEAGCQQRPWGKQATAGVLTPHLCGWDLVSVPAGDSQPPALSIALSPKSLESDRPEFKS